MRIGYFVCMCVFFCYNVVYKKQIFKKDRFLFDRFFLDTWGGRGRGAFFFTVGSGGDRCPPAPRLRVADEFGIRTARG